VSGTISPKDTPLEERFAFGANWLNFLTKLSDARIRAAEASLTAHLGALHGRSFLDVGSGSGLFSLAARNLGAAVVSFDYDPQSVACTELLRERYHPGDPDWTVFRGSALDGPMLAALGQFDVVYSWGVLHHTGDMWAALANVAPLVKPGGRLFLSIYNDQGGGSRRWKAFKKFFIACPRWLQGLFCVSHITYWQLRLALIHAVRLQNPLGSYLGSDRGRGMDVWYDTMDWLGGYPFEVATPEAIFDFFSAGGFLLKKLKTCGGGYGCNEYVFEYAGTGGREATCA